MKIAKQIFLGLMVVILLVCVFIVVSPRIFDGFYPFGIKTAIVLSDSMVPTIKKDDFVIMKKPNEINIDDVVSYKETESNMEVLHRVVKINGDEIITRGDANNTDDKPINKGQITGIYVGKMEYMGKIINFITTPIVFSIIITFLIILMIIPHKKHQTTEKKAEKNEEK